MDFTANDGSGNVVDQLGINSFNTGSASYLGEVNGTSAANSAFNGNAGEAVLDTSTNQVLVDADGSGNVNSGDLIVELAGVTDLESDNFVF